ncbi:MAG: hypothetical protein WBG86_07310 [Polyangiales bacterium]
MAALCILGGFLASCGFGDDQNAGLAPDNGCFDATDCTEGVCELGACVDASEARVGILVEVLRAPSDTERATPASWAYEVDAFSGSRSRDLTLPATRPVVGTIRWKDIPVSASVRFTRRASGSFASLAAPSVIVDTFREPSSTAGAGVADYEVALVPGETYDVVVLPTSDPLDDLAAENALPALQALPPIHATINVNEASASEPFRFDLTYPEALAEECGAEEFVGCSLAGTILSFDGAALGPASGLRVRAIEKQSGRVVSSIGITDEAGDFVIRVSADASPYVIRVTSTAGSGDPFPSISIDPELAFTEPPLERRVVVPRLDTVGLSGLVQDRVGVPVAAAALRFESTEIFEDSSLGLEGSYGASVSTAQDGRFNLQLFPGVYDVVVTPPDDADRAWAPAAATVAIFGGVSLDAKIVLGSQVRLSGSCVTFTGEPASGVTIAARAGDDLGGLQRSDETVSLPNGEYQMWVDSGVYDLVVKIADSTGFAWLLNPSFSVDVGGDSRVKSWQFPPPVVIRGVVRGASDEVVAQAPIRAYLVIGEENRRAVQIAETISGEDGNYQLLISPTLDGL